MPKPTIEVIPSTRIITKIGLRDAFQIVGGDVFTFIDVAKHRATMTDGVYGVDVVLAPKLAAPEKRFLVPWSNLKYVQYGCVSEQ